MIEQPIPCEEAKEGGAMGPDEKAFFAAMAAGPSPKYEFLMEEAKRIMYYKIYGFFMTKIL